MSSKAREALLAVYDCAKDGVLAIRESAFEKVVEAIVEPLRNCDIGTAEGQSVRHYEWCRKHGIDGDKEVACAHPDMTCSLCVLRWGQMPYESEVSNETTKA